MHQSKLHENFHRTMTFFIEKYPYFIVYFNRIYDFEKSRPKRCLKKRSIPVRAFRKGTIRGTEKKTVETLLKKPVIFTKALVKKDFSFSKKRLKFLCSPEILDNFYR